MKTHPITLVCCCTLLGLGLSTTAYGLPNEVNPTALAPSSSTQQENLALSSALGPWQRQHQETLLDQQQVQGSKQTWYLKEQVAGQPRYKLTLILLPHTTRTNLKNPMSNLMFALMLHSYDAATLSQLTLLNSDENKATILFQQDARTQVIAQAIKGGKQFYTLILSSHSHLPAAKQQTTLKQFMAETQLMQVPNDKAV